MKKFLVSNNDKERIDFIKNISFKKMCIYNDSFEINYIQLFDESYSLNQLYDDKTFFSALSKIDNNTVLFIINLGLKYCSPKADYIKPYLKIQPIAEQCKDVFIIDYFAFYQDEKTIYRPYLYILDDVFDETLQHFYGTGAYKDYTGNTIEEYYLRIKDTIKITTEKINIKTVKYNPTEIELENYEKLKNEIIKVKKYPKVKIYRILCEYINSLNSKQNVIFENNIEGYRLENLTQKSIIITYEKLIKNNYNTIVFFESNVFGIEGILLKKIKTAIKRHNKLIELING